jgi:hypothetical protein
MRGEHGDRAEAAGGDQIDMSIPVSTAKGGPGVFVDDRLGE